MALYDFICDDCGSAFEVFSVGFLKDEQKQCPQCGSRAVRQKYSAFLRGLATGPGCDAPPRSGFG